MGRPSAEKKRAKRKRQKQCKNLRLTVSSAPDDTVCKTSSSERITSSLHERHGSFEVSDSFNSTNEGTCIGNDDTNLIKMDLYDEYRREDGKQHTNHYLKKCVEKLMTKVRQQREKICFLEKDTTEMKIEHKSEQEKIRQFYDTIAFFCSRSGLIVCTTMGKTSIASRIIKELETLYSVDQDHNFQYH